jgi:hypothetical protein
MDTTPPAGAGAIASEGAAGGGVVHQPDVQQLLPSAGGPARLGFNQETAVGVLQATNRTWTQEQQCMLVLSVQHNNSTHHMYTILHVQ